MNTNHLCSYFINMSNTLHNLKSKDCYQSCRYSWYSSKGISFFISVWNPLLRTYVYKKYVYGIWLKSLRYECRIWQPKLLPQLFNLMLGVIIILLKPTQEMYFTTLYFITFLYFKHLIFLNILKLQNCNTNILYYRVDRIFTN